MKQDKNVNVDYNDDDTFISSENESIELSTQLSDDILLENIKKQLQDNFSFNDNLIITFMERYNYLVNNYSDNDYLKNLCLQIKNSFFSNILQIIIEKFSISTDILDKANNDNLEFYSNEFYIFFIANKNNFIKEFFVNYIDKNSENIINDFKDITNKKDLSYKNYKKKLTLIEKADYAHIFYNMSDIIIRYIESNTFASFIEDFYKIEMFTYNSSVSSMNNLFVKNEYNTYSANDTLYKYMNIFYSEDVTRMISDIEFELMNKLVRSFKNKK